MSNEEIRTSEPRLTPAILRAHANSPRTMTWEDVARMYLRWAADLIEAAQAVVEESKRGK